MVLLMPTNVHTAAVEHRMIRGNGPMLVMRSLAQQLENATGDSYPPTHETSRADGRISTATTNSSQLAAPHCLSRVRSLLGLRGASERPGRQRRLRARLKKKHGSLKFHGGEAWGRGVQGACGAYSGCILPSLVVSSLSRPRSLLFASCCLLFWRVFVRSLREHAGFKEGS